MFNTSGKLFVIHRYCRMNVKHINNRKKNITLKSMKKVSTISFINENFLCVLHYNKRFKNSQFGVDIQ